MVYFLVLREVFLFFCALGADEAACSLNRSTSLDQFGLSAESRSLPAKMKHNREHVQYTGHILDIVLAHHSKYCIGDFSKDWKELMRDGGRTAAVWKRLSGLICSRH